MVLNLGPSRYALGIINIQEEIEEYEKEHRIWRQAGSVSKPYSDDDDPTYDIWYRHHWSKEDLARLKTEREQEKYYKTHRVGLIKIEEF